MKLLVLFIFSLLFVFDTQAAKPNTCSSLDCTNTTTCYDKFTNKLDELLTKNEIQSVYPSIPEHAEFDYSQIGPIDYHTCQYEWESNRTYKVKVGQQEIDVKKPNKIGVGRLHTYKESIKDPLIYFNNAHRTPTEEEIAEYQKMVKKKMDEEGLAADQQKIGSDITSPFLEKISFTAMDGLGDAAAWDHMDSALVILVGREEFRIYVEISADVEENQELAIQLAKIVLAKC